MKTNVLIKVLYLMKNNVGKKMFLSGQNKFLKLKQRKG